MVAIYFFAEQKLLNHLHVKLYMNRPSNCSVCTGGMTTAPNNLFRCSYGCVSIVNWRRFLFSFQSFTVSHLCDAEDVLKGAAVAHGLAHPAEFSRHVAQPVDGFIGVALDNRQDLVVLLFGHIQQLGYLVQLHVQISDTGALWRDRRRRGQMCVKMELTQAVSVLVLHL